MKTRQSIRATLVLVAVALLAPASGPALAEEKKEPIEKFSARAFDLDRGEAAFLDIVIEEWTTPEERQALIQTLHDGGSEALYDALEDQSRKGYVKLPRTLGYDMQYAWQVEVEGKRHIVLASNRPMGFLELARNFRSTDYNVSLVVLEIDSTGKGEGSAAGGAELSLDEESGRLNIAIRGTRPTQLKKVNRTFPKKKKGQ